MNTDTVRRWRAMKQEVALLDAELKERKRELDALGQDVLADFERAGVNSVRLDDGTLVYMQRALRASVRAEDRDRAADVFRSQGLDDLVGVTINANTLSAYVREQERLGQPLPDPVEKIVNVAEMFDVRQRSGQ